MAAGPLLQLHIQDLAVIVDKSFLKATPKGETVPCLRYCYAFLIEETASTVPSDTPNIIHPPSKPGKVKPSRYYVVYLLPPIPLKRHCQEHSLPHEPVAESVPASMKSCAVRPRMPAPWQCDVEHFFKTRRISCAKAPEGRSKLDWKYGRIACPLMARYKSSSGQ
jgi:hypothetical protein